MMNRVSLVIPCYNEENNIPELRKRLSGLQAGWSFYLEIVLVDDGSRDETWRLLKDWAWSRPGIKAVRLAANQGNQIAMLTGIFHSTGDAVAVMDADLQDPPELIADLADVMDSHRSDAVIGVKASRHDSSILLSGLKTIATAFLPFRKGEGDFGLLKREVIPALLRAGSRNTPYRARRYRALLDKKVDYFPYQRSVRFQGESKFNLRKLALLWWRTFWGCYAGNELEMDYRAICSEIIVKNI